MTVRLDATASRQPDDQPLAFQWRMGSLVRSGGVVDHTFTAVGRHSVVLEARDGQGGLRRQTRWVDVHRRDGTRMADQLTQRLVHGLLAWRAPSDHPSAALHHQLADLGETRVGLERTINRPPGWTEPPETLSVLSGYLLAETPGDYAFWLEGGHRSLWLGGTHVASTEDGQPGTGRLRLARGYHPLLVVDHPTPTAEPRWVDWQPPGRPRRSLPDGVLLRESEFPLHVESTAAVAAESRPTARLVMDPARSRGEHLNAVLEAVDGQSPLGHRLHYTWHFGDGRTAEGPRVTHGFSSGVYTVTLVVDDGHGGISQRERTLLVTPSPARRLGLVLGPEPPDARLVAGWVPQGSWNALTSQPLVDHRGQELPVTVANSLQWSDDESLTKVAAGLPLVQAVAISGELTLEGIPYKQYDVILGCAAVGVPNRMTVAVGQQIVEAKPSEQPWDGRLLPGRDVILFRDLAQRALTLRVDGFQAGVTTVQIVDRSRE